MTFTWVWVVTWDFALGPTAFGLEKLNVKSILKIFPILAIAIG